MSTSSKQLSSLKESNEFFKNYQCEYCNKHFTRKENLRNHLDNIHFNLKNFQQFTLTNVLTNAVYALKLLDLKATIMIISADIKTLENINVSFAENNTLESINCQVIQNLSILIKSASMKIFNRVQI
eukprot:403354625